jgi:penicillin amidase
LRWTALDVSNILNAVFSLNEASNWEEFRAALSNWSVPSQNFVYADVEGNIGYQMPGNIPIRNEGDGTMPVPGWTDEFEWTGFIPFEDLPFSFNPPAGFVATANNAVVGMEYPYMISTQWDYGYRAKRIVEMIEALPQISIEDIKEIHGDNHNSIAPILIPILSNLEFEDEILHEKVKKLLDWDYQDDIDSGPAALFNVFWRHLILRTFSDDLPVGWLPGDSQAFTMIEHLVKNPSHPWWDDLRTEIVESRDDVFQMAFKDALYELEAKLGDDPTEWSWGDLHTATFKNATLGESGIPPIEALFNRGPFRIGGGSSIVNATGWDIEQGYELTTLPSERMIVDFSAFDNSLTIHPTGQSGHAFHPHYIDMADLWRTIQYHPMTWSRAAVESSAEAQLLLVP